MCAHEARNMGTLEILLKALHVDQVVALKKVHLEEQQVLIDAVKCKAVNRNL